MRVLAVVLLLAVTAFAASESSHESTHAQRAVSSMVSAALKGAAIKIKKNPAAAQPFHFTAVAGNHKIVLTSENYATLEGAQNGVESVLAHAGLRQNIKQVGSESAAGGKPYFKVQSDNGETIGVSETYSDASAAKKGADALHAIVVDITNSVAQSVPITPGKAGSSSSKGSSGKSGKSIAGKVRFGSGSVQPKKESTKKESTKKESGKKAKESSGKSSKKSVKAGHFEIKKTPAGFHYLIKGANQEIVASSEVYSSKDAVQKGVGAALRACGAKENLEVQKSEGAGFFVNCKAENNQKLFTTEIYTRASTGEDAIELLRGAIRATLHRYVKILPVTVAKSESSSSGASSARVSSAAKRESATSKVLGKKF